MRLFISLRNNEKSPSRTCSLLDKVVKLLIWVCIDLSFCFHRPGFIRRLSGPMAGPGGGGGRGRGINLLRYLKIKQSLFCYIQKMVPLSVEKQSLFWKMIKKISCLLLFCALTPVWVSLFRRSLMDIGGGGGGGPPAKQRDIEGALLR